MINSNDLKLEFENLFVDIKIPSTIKNKLLKDAFSNHYLYSHMPIVIAKLVNEKVCNDKLSKLSFYSYLYFSSILYYDKFIDNQLNDVEDEKTLTLFLFTIKEKAIQGLSALFSFENEFWSKFDELKNIYFKYSDSRYIKKIDNPNDNTFFEMAKGKGILAHNYVYSIKYLFGDINQIDELLLGLDNFNIGLQIFDDYKDIKEDYQNKQPNYLIFKIESKTDVKDKSFEYLYKLAFINHTITESLNNGLKYLSEAKIIFENLKIDLLLDKTTEIINFIRSEIYFINESITKATDKSKRTNVLSSNKDIQSSLKLSLTFLENNLNENFLWKDFLTNAGYGQEWITGYVLSMIGEIDKSIKFLEKPLYTLLNSKGSYNDYIVQDGDSTNFLLKAHSIFDLNISEELLNTWFKFSKTDGGWATYYNNDIKKCMNFPLDSDFSGWFSSKICVSAVSAWVAKDIKNEIVSKKYFDTINFLAKNQNSDGSWSSYWWTENIYATAFCVLSFPNVKEYKKIIENAISYLIKQQNKNGTWNNGKNESSFYTAISTKAIIHYYLLVNDDKLIETIKKSINWLLQNQMEDGSWTVTRILRIPSPEITDISKVDNWGNTSFGLNCLVDDHNRIFTTSTIFNTLSLYAKHF
jgi:hypothetical protein